MILTRPAIAEDRDFIVSGWSSSYRSSKNETTPMAQYPVRKHAEVEYYIERCSTLVAHGELGVLMGFIAYDPSTYVATIRGRRVTLEGYVLYVYTAGPFRRRFGVARRLFAAAGINPTQRFGYLCQTRSSWELRSKIPLAEHEPHRARYGETHGRAATEQEAATGGPASRADPGAKDLAP